MGRTGLARTALATVALSVPAVGMLAVPGAAQAAALPPSHPQMIAPQPKAPVTVAPAATLNSELASYAKKLEGVPYVFGGTSTSGFDCSGLTQFVYHHFGKAISRTADGQFHEFRAISKAHAEAGDLVFFHVSSNPSSYVYHVAVYEGGEYMVVASTGSGRVILQSFAWAGNTVTFGTITH
jgi:cell wall-associated NlpC family hydrolase